MDQTESRFLAHSECSELPKPDGEESCNRKGCEWRIGGWTDCSKTCGTGVQRRLVRCTRPVCHTERPADSQTCEIAECIQLSNPEPQNISPDGESSPIIMLNKNTNSLVPISGSVVVSEIDKKDDAVVEPKLVCLMDTSFDCKGSTINQCSSKDYRQMCCKTCEEIIKNNQPAKQQPAFYNEDIYQIYSDYISPDDILSDSDNALLEETLKERQENSNNNDNNYDTDYSELYRMF